MTVHQQADDAHGPPASAAPEQYALGVLLVHGIGSQPRGQTLIHWGDSLLATIARATGRQVQVSVERAGMEDGESGARPEAIVGFADAHHTEQWLLAEGWWADSFLAPSYRDLVSWSLRALPWAAAMYFVQRYWQVQDKAGFARIASLAVIVLQLVAVLLLSPLFLALLIAMLLLALIPLPQLRAAILAAQNSLTASFGDSLAFVESPMRAALIETRILDGLARLKEKCARTIVIAHSQGAAVVLNAMNGIGFPLQAEERERSHAGRPTDAPDALVTFGAGIKQLAGLKVLAGGITRSLGVDPVRFAVVVLLALSVTAAWLWNDWRRGVVDAETLGVAAGMWLLYVALFAGAGLLIFRLLPPLLRRSPKLAARAQDISIKAGTVLILAVVVVFLMFVDRADVPFMRVTVFIAAIALLIGSFNMMFSKDLRVLMTAVRHPAGLERWLDLYASADPVANGPLHTADHGVLESRQVWNEDSFFADHGTYWSNVDGFVLKVARVCAQTAGSFWTERLPAEDPYVDERARWRASWLRMIRHNLALTWTAFTAMMLVSPPDTSWLQAGAAAIPEWLTQSVRSFVPGPALVIILGAICYGASYAIARSIWRGWQRAEQQAALTGQPQADNGVLPIMALGAVFWTALVLVGATASGSSPVELFSSPGEVLAGAMPIMGGALISAVVLLRLNPAPRARGKVAASEVLA